MGISGLSVASETRNYTNNSSSYHHGNNHYYHNGYYHDYYHHQEEPVVGAFMGAAIGAAIGGGPGAAAGMFLGALVGADAHAQNHHYGYYHHGYRYNHYNRHGYWGTPALYAYYDGYFYPEYLAYERYDYNRYNRYSDSVMREYNFYSMPRVNADVNPTVPNYKIEPAVQRPVQPAMQESMASNLPASALNDMKQEKPAFSINTREQELTAAVLEFILKNNLKTTVTTTSSWLADNKQKMDLLLRRKDLFTIVLN